MVVPFLWSNDEYALSVSAERVVALCIWGDFGCGGRI